MFYAVYTMGLGSQDAPIETAYNAISPYLDGHYFTGDKPPVAIMATPFTAVIDLDDMVVVDKDVYSESYMMGIDEVMAAVQEAAAD